MTASVSPRRAEVKSKRSMSALVGVAGGGGGGVGLIGSASVAFLKAEGFSMPEDGVGQPRGERLTGLALDNQHTF